ncbi:MAG: HD domain-containing protein [Nanoarchaeota archaeon]
MINQTKISLLKKKIIGFYARQDMFHGVHHLRRTMLLANKIMRKGECDRSIVIAGVLLHQLHDSKKASVILSEVGISKKDAAAVIHCVACCHPMHISKVKTIEAKIVYDADKVQCCGWRGKLREFACNFFVRKKSLLASWQGAVQVENDSFAHLQTAEGKMYGAKLWRW